MSYLSDFLAEAGLAEAEAVTLLRLAATIAAGDDYAGALTSFSEPEEVRALARRTAQRLYGAASEHG